MTKNRVYVEVGGNDLLRIYYFDNNNKRIKQIDLKPPAHNNKLPHVHHGYEHNEDIKPVSNLTEKEKKLLARIKKKWYNYLNGK